MPKCFFLRHCLVLLTCALPSFGMAQETGSITDRLREAAQQDSQTAGLLRQIDSDLTNGRKGRALSRVVSRFYQIAHNGVLTEQSVMQAQLQQRAAQRGRLMGQYLSYDLNADGQISQSERDAVQGQEAATVLVLFASADTNNDGLLTTDELLTHANNELPESLARITENALMAFDVNQDGEVHIDEIVATIDAIEADPLFAEVSRNRLGQFPFATQPTTCDAPQAPDGARLIVLSAYEGSALSTVSVAGLNDVTHVGKIVIEEGDQPIYLMITAYSNMIWELSGATDRLTHLVVQEGRVQNGAGPGAGVVGLAADKVHFIAPGTCANGYIRVDSDEGRRTFAGLERNFGQTPDAMLSYYTVAQIALPSGTGRAEQGEGRDIITYNGRRYEMTPEGPRLLDESEGQRPDRNPAGATRTYQSMLRFSPDGIRGFDTEDVISSGEVVPYDVFPQQAGLLQLLLEEKLTFSRDGYYVIEQEIPRFPAGLNGGHSVRFRLAEGVDLPDGSPGHSSVVSAGTGECLTRVCLR